MGVSVAAGSAVHIEDARVQRLLVVQRKGHCIQTTSPILPSGFLEHIKKKILQYDKLRNEEFFGGLDHAVLTAMVWSKIRPPLRF